LYNKQYLQSLSADFQPLLHTATFIWIHYPLMYCNNCTLPSSSTISWCSTITEHCDLHLDLLSAGVIPLLHIIIFTCVHYQMVYWRYCYPHVDPLPAGVLSSLHIAIFTWIHLSAALLTLWYILSSFEFTISWCNAITTQLYHHLDPLSAGVLPSLHTVIFTWIHYW
jgi:hypothetical protein